MARLTKEQKIFVVTRVACFDTATEIAAAFKEQFGTEITIAAIGAYDPMLRAGRSLSRKYRDLFDATRKAFLEDTSHISIAHKAVRLRRLDRYCARAEQRGNLPLAAGFLEQAAKECGNAFTNRHEHTGKGGGPIQHEHTKEQIDGIMDAAVNR